MSDVLTVLQKLQELGLIRLHKQSGSYYQVYCPIHSEGNERKPSCGILLEDQVRDGTLYPAGFVHCFACGYANTLPKLITDILKSKSISMSGAEWLKLNVPGFVVESSQSILPPELLKSLMHSYAVSYVENIVKPKLQYVTESELDKYRYIVPYMYERGLTDEIIQMFDVGYDANWVPPGKKNPCPCITFPVHDRDGNTLFLCRRAISYKLYNYPRDIIKPLYGIDKIPKDCKTLVVVESCINALTAWKWGYPAVALMGTGTSLQMRQLQELGVANIVLAMDGDDAGRRAADKIAKALKSCSMVWRMEMPDGKDVNDITKSEFEKLFAERI